MIASQTVLIRILIRNELGVLETPASTPTMTLFRNGADPSVTVTPSLITTGVYTAGWTNGAWNVGDIIQLQVSSVFGAFTFVDNYNFVIGLSSASFPNNFSDLFIDSAGRVRPTPASIAFNIGVETPNIGFDSSGFVYVKELDRTVTFTANTDIEEIDLVLVFENADRTDILSVPDEDLTKVGNVVTYILPDSLTQMERTLIWGIREATNQTVYGFGQIQIVYAPHVDDFDLFGNVII